MAQRSSSSKWEDIPTEVLEQIVQYMDYSSLSAVSRLSRRLNYLATTRYLGQNVIDQISRESTLITAFTPDVASSQGNHRWEPLHIVTIALWLKELKIINHFTPAGAGYPQFVSDARRLTRFIRSMPTSSLNILKVSNYDARDAVDEYLHLKTWKDLLEAAFLKGCRELLIKELDLHIFGRAHHLKIASPEVEFGARDDSDSENIHGGKDPNSSLDLVIDPASLHTISAHLNATLEILHIYSGFFFQPLLLPFTVNIFHCHAETMTSLIISDTPPHIEVVAWETFLQEVSLPFLNILELRYIYHLPVKTFASFLSRHLAIIKLEIAGPRFDIDQPFPIIDVPTLQNLQCLQARPQILAWILRCSSPSYALEFVKPLDVYHQITRTTVEVWFSDLEEALNAIHASRPGGSVPIPSLELEVTLDFYSFKPSAVAARMLNQVESLSAIERTPWSRITMLTLNDLSSPMHRATALFSDTLPRWIALFPSLSELRLFWSRMPSQGPHDPLLISLSDTFSFKYPSLKVVIG
ncbi:hypothetical protein AN958_03169 [Leucoagaricus sp. SymC.cos]|nr:hypothetical protein AN958_03169 [Leucoagaricus sp. SymC.cos]